MSARQRITARAAFWTYFNAADELSAPELELDDLMADFVADARQGATDLGLPWPPELAAAEEYVLSNPEFARGEDGW